MKYVIISPTYANSGQYIITAFSETCAIWNKHINKFINEMYYNYPDEFVFNSEREAIESLNVCYNVYRDKKNSRIFKIKRR